ncbi:MULTISPECIES: DMT family transporter [Lactiplantibacillus]|uniref:Putative inner membrane transporter YicL n=1 Tax=Lactiplantibacillus plantarum subsp. plantarum TaxID=337330 RepID=A0A2S3U9F4_LACPN|nr:EamA family transporter [Lactiplantibacillus plantarum]AGE40348.1 Drug/metabolite transport protein, EamA family [Lactiplantibacillus plantarum ZJ316]ANJ15063.1 peptide ABC transporter ATP-binding protein [Lactiplantibacillus plantarum]ASL80848.1 Permease of the drug/metabolite transporter (DMT) superfamily [Lactiplantibacillus plantarum]KAF1282877.1 peptide ABC transporter ATP-binding protein [Lactiplantibacillus plantarum]MBO2717700.1 EamA family transporter [Lactiplantibacillus plantarum
MQKKTVGLLLASAGPFLWGSSGTVAQHLFDTTTISPLWLVAVRMLVSGGLLILYGFSRRLPVMVVFHDWWATVRLIVFSLFGMAGVQLTYFMAISTGNAAMAAILQFLSPVMIIIFITATTWQLPGKVDVISVVSAIAGTVLIVTEGHTDSLALPVIAIIWGLLAAVGATIYTLMPTKLLKVYGATPIVGWSMLIGGGLVLVGTGAWHHSPQLTWVAWGQVGFVVIFGTMLAYLFFLQSLEYILPTTASVLGAIEPLAATILSVLFLHVHFNWVGLIGAIMIVGVTILQFAATRANQFVSK